MQPTPWRCPTWSHRQGWSHWCYLSVRPLPHYVLVLHGVPSRTCWAGQSGQAARRPAERCGRSRGACVRSRVVHQPGGASGRGEKVLPAWLSQAQVPFHLNVCNAARVHRRQSGRQQGIYSAIIHRPEGLSGGCSCHLSLSICRHHTLIRAAPGPEPAAEPPAPWLWAPGSSWPRIPAPPSLLGSGPGLCRSLRRRVHVSLGLSTFPVSAQPSGQHRPWCRSQGGSTSASWFLGFLPGLCLCVSPWVSMHSPPPLRTSCQRGPMRKSKRAVGRSVGSQEVRVVEKSQAWGLQFLNEGLRGAFYPVTFVQGQTQQGHEGNWGRNVPEEGPVSAKALRQDIFS